MGKVIGFITPYCHRMASHRYRAEMHMREMRKLGVKVVQGAGDVTVLQKWEGEYNKKALNQIKDRPFVYDISDDHFKTERAEGYLDIIRRATGLVAATEHISSEIKRITGRESEVISDGYEFPECAPGMPNRGENILFFGHDSNLPALSGLIPYIPGNLCIISNHNSACRQWSKETVFEALEWADIVILPSDPDEASRPSKGLPATAGKSPNRLVEAVRRGRYVVASKAVPSYEPYGMWRGDILEGIEWVKSHPKEALDQVHNAQSLVKELNDPAKLAVQWRDYCYGVESGRNV